MTAVEWLVQQICGKHTEAWQNEIQQALEMEKEQIIDAISSCTDGVSSHCQDFEVFCCVINQL